MMEHDELTNQLKSQNLATVSPAAFLQVGGPTFPDARAHGGLEMFGHVVEAYRAVHLPSYGSPIPLGGQVNVAIGDDALLSPTTNEVFKVQFIVFENTGASQIIVSVTCGGLPIPLVGASSGSISYTIPAGATLSWSMDLHVDKTLPLAVTVTDGDAADSVVSAVSIRTSQ